MHISNETKATPEGHIPFSPTSVIANQPTRPSPVEMRKLKVVRKLRGVRKSQHTIKNKNIVFLIKLVEEENMIAFMTLQRRFSRP
jgi:hypothetical protein